jgi:hypothetical protein
MNDITDANRRLPMGQLVVASSHVSEKAALCRCVVRGAMRMPAAGTMLVARVVV